MEGMLKNVLSSMCVIIIHSFNTSVCYIICFNAHVRIFYTSSWSTCQIIKTKMYCFGKRASLLWWFHQVFKTHHIKLYSTSFAVPWFGCSLWFCPKITSIFTVLVPFSPDPWVFDLNVYFRNSYTLEISTWFVSNCVASTSQFKKKKFKNSLLCFIMYFL